MKIIYLTLCCILISIQTYSQIFPIEIPIGEGDTTYQSLNEKGMNYLNSLNSAGTPSGSSSGASSPAYLDDRDYTVEKKFQNWKKFALSRAGKNGSVLQYERTMNALNSQSAAYLDHFNRNSFTSNIFWKELGPDQSQLDVNQCQVVSTDLIAPQIGVISAILPIQNEQNRVILVSTGSPEFGKGGGIFKTRDGGQNWVNTTDDEKLSFFNYSTFAKDPLNKNFVVAGIAGNGSGCIYSTDEGNSWSKSGFFNLSNKDVSSLSAVKIFVNPTNWSNGAKKVCVVTKKSICASTKLGLDNSFTFKSFPTLAWDEEYLDAELIKPDNNNLRRYITIDSRKILGFKDDYEPQNTIINIRYTDISGFNSVLTEGGITFNYSSMIRGTIEQGKDQNNEFIFICLVARYERYVNGNREVRDRFVFLSSINNGSSFSIFNSANNAFINQNMNHLFKVSPNFPNRWYMERNKGGFSGCTVEGDNRLMASSDNYGATWSTMVINNLSGTHVDQRTIEFLKSGVDGDILIAGHDGGVSIFESRNGTSARWYNANGRGLTVGRLHSVATTDKRNNIILTGSHDGNHNYLNGNIWQAVGDGDKFESILDISPSITNPPAVDIITNIVSNYVLGTFRLTPGPTGQIHNFANAFDGFPIGGVHNAPNTYYAIRRNTVTANNHPYFIYRSANWGNDWTALITNPICSTESEYHPSSIWISDDENVLYYTVPGFGWFNYGNNTVVSNDHAGIFKMTKTNNVWSSPVNITNNLYLKSKGKSADGNDKSPISNNHSLLSVMADASDPNIIWVTLGGTNTWENDNNVLSTHKVYKSTNGGATWVDWSNGLPAVPVNCILMQRDETKHIYVGTDVGVFYLDNPNDNVWKYYGDNQPGCQVRDLNINYCDYKIYAATWGRGLWSAPVFNDLKITNNTQEVIPLGTQYNAPGDIYIEAGSSMVVRGVLRLNPNKKITVQTGGMLYVDGGTIDVQIKPCDVTNRFWEGIEMIGDGFAMQEPVENLYDFGLQIPKVFNSAISQPVCIFKNAIIANARTAVSATKRGNNVYTPDFSGGIVIADNTAFNNNHRSAEFVYYRMRDPNSPSNVKKYQSIFKRCKFVWNNYIDPSPEAMVTNWGTVGIKFLDCTFENKTPSSQNLNENKGRGVYSIDGSVIISTNCPRNAFGECYCSEPPNCDFGCKFINLYRGVDIQSSGLTTNIGVSKVFNTEIRNCLYGIRYLGMNNPEITYNNFTSNLNNISSNFPFSKATVGIHLEGCSGVQFVTKNVMEGTFLNGGIQPLNMVGNNWGIILAGGGLMDASIYQNTINNFKAGMVSLGTNGSANSGLVWKCNKFEECYLDIDAFRGTDAIPNYFLNIPLGTYNDPGASINGKQGDCGFIPQTPTPQELIVASKKPANNIFTTNINYLPPGFNQILNAQHFDLHARTGMLSYTYYYPDVNNIRFEPISFSFNFITPQRCLQTPNYLGEEESSSCSRLSKSNNPYGLKVTISDKIWEIANLKNTLNNIDAEIITLDRDLGNANGNTITGIISDLIALDYVFPSVLNHAINHPDIGFALPQLKQLLIKNSALEDSTVLYLSEANLPYTTEEMNNLLSHQEQQSPYNRFKGYPAVLNAELQGLKNELANIYIEKGDLDSAITELLIDTTATSLEIALPLCVADNQCNRAQEILGNLLQKNNEYYSPYATYYNMICREKNNLSWDWKNADTTTIDTLKQLAQSNTPIAAKALAALSYITGMEYKEPVPNLDIEEAMKTNAKEVIKSKWINFRTNNASNLKIFPNPNKGKFTLSITGKQIGNTLEVYNNNGEKILRIRIENISAISKEIDLTHLPSGIYLMVMKDNERSIDQVPFIINTKQ